MLITEQCTIADLANAPNIAALMDEYAAETSIKGMPPHNAKQELYEQIEASGSLSVYRALLDGVLVGFLLLLTPVLPHYGVYISTTESFFVTKPARTSGAGIQLLKTAEHRARELGSSGLLVSAPLGGSLANWLEVHKEYSTVNRVFFRSFAP